MEKSITCVELSALLNNYEHEYEYNYFEDEMYIQQFGY